MGVVDRVGQCVKGGVRRAYRLVRVSERIVTSGVGKRAWWRFETE